MLSWDDFRHVKAIADSRSLNGAAQALGINHSTAFRRLGQIEQRLGARLFKRNRSGYSLTPAGEEMVRLAERMEQARTGQAPRLGPWLWGINGAFGVCASGLALGCSMVFGIRTTLIVGTACYVLLPIMTRRMWRAGS